MEGTQISAYRLVSELGSGGMGKVYLAETLRPAAGLGEGCRVALKIIHPHLLETEGFFKRFLREAEVGKAVRHDNVVATFDCDAVMKDGQQHNFLVMEYVEGQTLRELFQELKVVPEELCRHIALETAKAVVAIHERNIVHRDLKPENVLVTEDHVVKVMDLGVARLQDEVIRLSHTGMFVGSVHYAAPEQFMTDGADVDGRADLHALGVMLYELSTGTHPYQSDDVRAILRAVLTEVPRRIGEVNPQISPFFEEVVQVLIAKERGDRFSSAAELLEILEQGEASEWWKERARALRKETQRPLRRMRVPRETALYGRDTELEKLQSLYDQAKAGHGQVLLVQGEAGIGRTRLVDEFVGTLQQKGEDLNFLFGHYPPGGAATAAGAFSTAYREQFGSEGLEETLSRYLTESPALIPAFAALLRGDPTPKGEEPLNKDSLQTVFVHVTRALAKERPTVVLVDDLHFAPEDGRALFASLALAVADHRVLLIATSRPDLPDTWVSDLDRQDHFNTLDLQRLGAREVGRLIKDVFRSQRLADKLGFQIVTKADGNPFFVFEILRGLREGNYITRSDDGTWVSSQEIEDIQIPSSLVDLIESRISAITEEDRDLLDVAACCGYEFDPGLVADACGIPRIAALKRFGRMEKRQRLVRSVGRQFAFDHHQIQEAIYAALPEMLREEYHAAVAQTLERNSGAADTDPATLPGALAVDLCEQFFKGRRNPEALRYVGAALDYLEKGYLNDAALGIASRALDVDGLVTGTERVDLLLRKAGRLGLLGHREEERACLDLAIPLAESLGATGAVARAQFGLGTHLYLASSLPEALEALEDVTRAARAHGDKLLECKAERIAGNAIWAMGNLEEARGRYERAVEIARELGDPVEEGGSTNNLANIYNNRGDVERARAFYEQAMELLTRGDNKVFEVRVANNLANTSRALGRLGEARGTRDHALELSRSIGDRPGEVHAQTGAAEDEFFLGRLDAALRRADLANALAREMGDQFGLGSADLILARLNGALGRFDVAVEHAKRALAVMRDLKMQHMELSALSVLGNLHRQQGDPGESERRLREALERHGEDTEFKVERAETLVDLGATLNTLGRSDEAIAAVEEAFAVAKASRAVETAATALSERVVLPGGDPALLVEALETDTERLSISTQLFARFRLWQATGDLVHLAEAHRLLELLRDGAPSQHRESMIENVPHLSEIASARGERGTAPP